MLNLLSVAAVLVSALTAVALDGLSAVAFAPSIVPSATCDASRRHSLSSLSRRLARGDAATYGIAPSRSLSSFLVFGRGYRSYGSSPLALRSTEPGRSGGRGRGRGRTQGRGRGRGRGRGGGQGRGRRSGPDFRTCQNVVELAELAHCNLDSMSNRDIAALWSLLPRLIHKRGAPDPNLEEKLKSVIDTTSTKLDSFQYRDLAQTSFGIAKTVSQVSRDNRRYRGDDPRQILRDLLVKESQYLHIFDGIASSAVGMLDTFDARHLSNLIYSYGLVEYNPDIGGDALFDAFGQAAANNLQTFNQHDISNMLMAFVYVDAKNSRLFQKTGEGILGMDLGGFTGQALANMLWSFAKSREADPELFQALGDHIVGGSLEDFWPQALSNIVWAYATAGVSHPELLKKIGDHVAGLDSLASFKPQELSTTAWAFATAGVSHLALFKKIGHHVAGLKSLESFNPQALSITAWAYATAGVPHPVLFKKIGHHVAGLDSLESFKPQELSNTVWAFASAGVPHLELFDKIGDHVAGLKSLDSFKPQELSNIVWAFASAGVPHPKLFAKIGDHVAGMDSLDAFNSQALSNTAWAFATAGVLHPELFNKIGDHVAGLKSLDSFKPQELSNTAWAYATARLFDRRLFEKLVTEAVVKKDSFDQTQHIANFLWACATVGYTDERLFAAFAPVVASKLDQCNEQGLTNIAWAYSVANVPGQELFVVGFGTACASKEKTFSREDFNQLHQWQLWQQELGTVIELPQSLQEKCRDAFVSASYSGSKLQNDVVSQLEAVGLDLDEEVLLGSGYRIDALVKVGDGRRVAVEVDGPFHSIQRRPAGGTVLKHRQVARLDRIEVVPVPYWEWNELKNSEMKQRYLRERIGFETT